MTNLLDRLSAALTDRYTIERELGARPKTISDGRGRYRTVEDDPESSTSSTVSDRLRPSWTVSL